jgi:hypothetical protein
MKAHKIKYKNTSGEVVARGYTIAIKKNIIESLKLEDKELTVEVKNNTIVIRRKDENN